MSTPPPPPPGWYPDPSGGDQRYWDGTQWTENSTNAPQVPSAASAGDQGASGERRDEAEGRSRWILPAVAIAVVIVAIGLVVVFGRSQPPEPPAASPVPASQTPPTARVPQPWYTQRPTPSEIAEPAATATPPPPVVELPVSEVCEAECHPSMGEMVITPSGNQHCLVRADTVACHIDFSVSTPRKRGQPATGVQINADGEWDWMYDRFAPKDAITLTDGTNYRARGWTIEPIREGVTFTNDATGHGIFVSVDGVEPF